VHGERQKDLGAAEHPFDVRVAGDSLERVGHSGNEHVERDDHGQRLENGIEERSHGLCDVVVVGRLLAVYGRRVIDDHRAGGGRRHAEHAPEERLERRVHVDKRIVLLGLVTGVGVNAPHILVVLVEPAQARGKRHDDDAENGGQPGKVRGHLS